MVQRGNVLHHVKREEEEELSGRGKCPDPVELSGGRTHN